MIASTRFLSRLGVFGLMMAVGTGTPTDSTRHVRGYGGLVPLPPAVESTASDLQQALELLGQRRLVVRTEKSGRVLYANERVTMPAGSDDARAASSASRAKHPPCPQLVQSHSAVGAPNS
jgi:hypothetical protein